MVSVGSEQRPTVVTCGYFTETSGSIKETGGIS
jgi:hypothetical protein